MSTTIQAIDQAKLDEFMGRVVGELGGVTEGDGGEPGGLAGRRRPR